MTTTGKQLFTTLTSDGTLTVEIANSEFPDPTGNQVLVKMEAAPINPSDLAILPGAADFENAEYSPGKVVAKMPEPFNSGQKARHGQRLPAGNEGAGTVVATGDSDMAKALMGQRVACVPGTAFSEYAIADAAMCLPLGDHGAEAGASSFVNPMTALGFAENAGGCTLGGGGVDGVLTAGDPGVESETRGKPTPLGSATMRASASA